MKNYWVKWCPIIWLFWSYYVHQVPPIGKFFFRYVQVIGSKKVTIKSSTHMQYEVFQFCAEKNYSMNISLKCQCGSIDAIKARILVIFNLTSLLIDIFWNELHGFYCELFFAISLLRYFIFRRKNFYSFAYKWKSGFSGLLIFFYSWSILWWISVEIIKQK